MQTINIISRNALAREAGRRKTATQILERLQLLERWAKHGTPYLVGAVAYDLVVAPDIDIEIYCPDTPRIEDGLDILRGCALTPQVRGIHYENHIDEADQGYYWQIHVREPSGIDWKVDMWSVRHDHPGPTSRDMVDPMRRALTDETRAAILKIKEAMIAGKMAKCISIYIYQAVLQDNVRTWEEFHTWREDHPDIGLVAWKPD